MNDYEKQANDLLASMGVEFKAEFSFHGPYFLPDEKETRDVYNCTFSRKGQSFSIRFGQSLAHSVCGDFQSYVRIFKSRPYNHDETFDEWLQHNGLPLKVRIGWQACTQGTNKANWELLAYRASDAVAKELGQVRRPTAYDVIASLTKYNPMTFEHFCSDFGYNTDSIAAKNTFDAVVQEWLQVSAFFSAAEIEKLQEVN
jgi:hypothetical protein